MPVEVMKERQEHAVIWARRLDNSLIDICELLEMGYTHISVSG